jgi:FkbM family methyltransferase
MGFRTAIAFEPVPGVYSRVCRNVERNEIRNVETVPAAVLDRTGEVTTLARWQPVILCEVCRRTRGRNSMLFCRHEAIVRTA